MAKRRARRRAQQTRSARPRVPPQAPPPAPGWCEADHVDRLVYTRRQAAEALGMSLATLDRRVIPEIETVKMPWGARLIPVRELERLLAEHQEAPRRERPRAVGRGRPRMVADGVVDRIRRERAAGRSLRAIASGLEADGVPTGQGGNRWWPSTVRHLLEPRQADTRRSVSARGRGFHATG